MSSPSLCWSNIVFSLYQVYCIKLQYLKVSGEKKLIFIYQCNPVFISSNSNINLFPGNTMFTFLSLLNKGVNTESSQSSKNGFAVL